MLSDIVSEIQATPVWSFSREVALEPGEYMELALNCTIHPQVVDEQIVLLVTPLDPVTPAELKERIWEKMVRQQMWDAFQIMPTVVFFHPAAGFL